MMGRKKVNLGRYRSKFNRSSNTTKAINKVVRTRRGGIRL